jgi:hypothetical protein
VALGVVPAPMAAHGSAVLPTVWFGPNSTCLQCPLVIYLLLSILIFSVHPIPISSITIISFYFLSFNLISPFLSPPSHTLSSSCFHHPSSPVTTCIPSTTPPFLPFRFLPSEALPIEGTTYLLCKSGIGDWQQVFECNLKLT